jgi:hypothetical protein
MGGEIPILTLQFLPSADYHGLDSHFAKIRLEGMLKRSDQRALDFQSLVSYVAFALGYNKSLVRATLTLLPVTHSHVFHVRHRACHAMLCPPKQLSHTSLTQHIFVEEAVLSVNVPPVACHQEAALHRSYLASHPLHLACLPLYVALLLGWHCLRPP